MSELAAIQMQTVSPEEENKSLVRQFLNAVDTGGGFAAGMKLCTADFTLHAAGLGSFDREGTSQLGEAIWKAFPDLAHAMVEQIAAGDRVVNRFTARATHRGEFQGVAATDRPIEYEGISIYRFAGDRIAEVWVVADFLSLMQQIGAVSGTESTSQ